MIVLDELFEKHLELCFGSVVCFRDIESLYDWYLDEDRKAVLRSDTTYNHNITIVNVVKVSNAINDSYTNCYEKLKLDADSLIIKNYKPSEDEIINCIKRILVFVIMCMYIVDKKSVSKYIKITRNIHEEVANEMGVSVEYVKNLEMGVSYTVDEEPVDDWDSYFFNICKRVASKSQCLSRRIGAILVDDDNNIISSGYNGPPRKIERCDRRWYIDTVFKDKYFKKGMFVDGKCPRRVMGLKSGEMIDICPAVHAEENSILTCAMRGVKAKGKRMFVTCGIPCGKCMNKIINVGIKEMIVTKLSFYDDMSKYLLENSDVKVRLYDFIK